MDPESMERMKSKMFLTRTEALSLLQDFADKPVFNVKIGICSPQVENVTFEEALTEMDRCRRCTTENMEYVFIYASDFVNKKEDLDRALLLFNLGVGRANLNQGIFHT